MYKKHIKTYNYTCKTNFLYPKLLHTVEQTIAFKTRPTSNDLFKLRKLVQP